jgi:two-component system response regulator
MKVPTRDDRRESRRIRFASSERDIVKPYVLVVEDDPADVHLIRRGFAINGIPSEVVVLTDGAQVCEFLFTSEGAGRGYPHVILLDWTLPKIPAGEVLDRIRSDPRTHLIPVVVLTSGKRDGAVMEAYRLGANGWIRKPPSFVDVVEDIRQVGLYWLGLNEARAQGSRSTQKLPG